MLSKLPTIPTFILSRREKSLGDGVLSCRKTNGPGNGNPDTTRTISGDGNDQPNGNKLENCCVRFSGLCVSWRCGGRDLTARSETSLRSGRFQVRVDTETLRCVFALSERRDASCEGSGAVIERPAPGSRDSLIHL
ncbi:hypothetical protein GWI33_007423 [Rhynchophorus ferrugineus]|uniref:Uncharacterized protein n=1 Tax=Rhynchophorus ferrugineus TaxID=354439 RepID=A0A834IEF1_RHYFE|nr:hypothetical protein GWI33_007423 [Rhynchophorus ferrugineus]